MQSHSKDIVYVRYIAVNRWIFLSRYRLHQLSASNVLLRRSKIFFLHREEKTRRSCYFCVDIQDVQGGESIFSEVIILVILSKIVYVHLSYSEWFPR
jgi:hypothetical protein